MTALWGIDVRIYQHLPSTFELPSAVAKNKDQECQRLYSQPKPLFSETSMISLLGNGDYSQINEKHCWRLLLHRCKNLLGQKTKPNFTKLPDFMLRIASARRVPCYVCWFQLMDDLKKGTYDSRNFQNR